LKEEALDRTMWRNRFGRGFGLVVWQITDDDDDDDIYIYICKYICHDIQTEFITVEFHEP